MFSVRRFFVTALLRDLYCLSLRRLIVKHSVGLWWYLTRAPARACSDFFLIEPISFLKSPSGVTFAFALYLSLYHVPFSRWLCSLAMLCLELFILSSARRLGGLSLYWSWRLFWRTFRGLLGDISCPFDCLCSILLDIHKEIAWPFISRSIDCWSSSHALG